MAESQGSLRVHRHEQSIIFQVEGRAEMGQGLALRRFAEQALAEGVASLRVDLRSCAHMDSTFIGTLLLLQHALTRRKQGQVVLVAPSPACGRLLEQMGLCDAFPVLTPEDPGDAAWTVLPTDPPSFDVFQRGVIQAHQELACLPGPVGERFRKVVRCVAEGPQRSTAP
jgi:anti-anti-sigma factor